MRTGYSCVNMRRKTKHSCTASVEHWCNATGKLIDPMTCNRQCEQFQTLAAAHCRPASVKIGVELL
jgi:hypothetical protein